MQNENIETCDENISVEIKSIMFKINTADTQLNTSCLIKELKTQHRSNFNAIVESFHRSCFFNITSFEDHEKRSVRASFFSERALIIVDFVSVIVIRSLVNEQHQNSDDSAEIKKK